MASKDNSDEAQKLEGNDKGPEAEGNPKEGSQAGRRSRIRKRTACSGGEEAAAKAHGYAERVKSKDGLEREENQLQETS